MLLVCQKALINRRVIDELLTQDSRVRRSHARTRRVETLNDLGVVVCRILKALVRAQVLRVVGVRGLEVVDRILVANHEILPSLLRVHKRLKLRHLEPNQSFGEPSIRFLPGEHGDLSLAAGSGALPSFESALHLVEARG